MKVYPTKRDFVVPDWLYKNTAKNATGATAIHIVMSPALTVRSVITVTVTDV